LIYTISTINTILSFMVNILATGGRPKIEGQALFFQYMLTLLANGKLGKLQVSLGPILVYHH
jgi:hypothetical protein